MPCPILFIQFIKLSNIKYRSEISLIQRLSRSREQSNTSAWCTASIHNGWHHRNRKPFRAWPIFAVHFWGNVKNSGVLILPPEICTILSKQYCVQASIPAWTDCMHQLPADSIFCGWRSRFQCIYLLVHSRGSGSSGLMVHCVCTVFPQRHEKCSRLGHKRFPSVSFARQVAQV